MTFLINPDALLATHILPTRPQRSRRHARRWERRRAKALMRAVAASASLIS